VTHSEQSSHCASSTFGLPILSQLQKKPAMLQIISLEKSFDFGDVQILLKYNHVFAMKEPILFVSDYLGIESGSTPCKQ
jgi:hypothetical protein